MDKADEQRILEAVGVRPQGWRPAAGHGAPSNRRYIVDLPGGQTAFVKIAAFEYTADWLRREHASYTAFAGRSFLPRLLGWSDDGEHPALVTEDLSDARWPPPWDDGLIGQVLEVLDEIHASAPPPDALDMAMWREELTSWPVVAAEPDGVLGLGLCTPGWLDGAIDTLIDAEATAPMEGGDTLHMDVRSDNLCLREDGSVVLVDWNWVSVGSGAFETACWLPSLAHEGGPAPEDVVPDVHPGSAAILAGYFAEHASRPMIPQAPHVRGLQLAQAKVALPWAARLLGLPSPDPER